MSGIDEYEARNQTPHFVYTAWDANRRPLYVGCTANVARRMRDHRYQSGWYGRLDTLIVMEFPTQREALTVETHQIIKLRPAANIRHNPRYQTVEDAIAEYESWWEYDAQFSKAAAREWLAAHPDATRTQHSKMTSVARWGSRVA